MNIDCSDSKELETVNPMIDAITMSYVHTYVALVSNCTSYLYICMLYHLQGGYTGSGAFVWDNTLQG